MEALIVAVDPLTLLEQPLTMDSSRLASLGLPLDTPPMTLYEWRQFVYPLTSTSQLPSPDEQYAGLDQLQQLTTLLTTDPPPFGLTILLRLPSISPLYEHVHSLAGMAPGLFPRFQREADDSADDDEELTDENIDAFFLDVIERGFKAEAERQGAVLASFGPKAAALMIPGWEWLLRSEIPYLQKTFEELATDSALFQPEHRVPFETIFAYDQPYQLIGIVSV